MRARQMGQYLQLTLGILWLISGNIAGAQDISDLTAASNAKGCNLIPYENTKTTCNDANANIHLQDSCDATSCSRTTDHTSAWQKCVDNRGASNQAFQTAINRLTDAKKNLWTGPRNKRYRDLATAIINKIKLGQPTHVTELKKAKQNLTACQRIFGG